MIHGMCLYINTTIIVLRRVKIDNYLDHPSKSTCNYFQLISNLYINPIILANSYPTTGLCMMVIIQDETAITIGDFILSRFGRLFSITFHIHLVNNFLTVEI